jgi:hypothetical protein
MGRQQCGKGWLANSLFSVLKLEKYCTLHDSVQTVYYFLRESFSYFCQQIRVINLLPFSNVKYNFSCHQPYTDCRMRQILRTNYRLWLDLLSLVCARIWQNSGINRTAVLNYLPTCCILYKNLRPQWGSPWKFSHSLSQDIVFLARIWICFEFYDNCTHHCMAFRVLLYFNVVSVFLFQFHKLPLLF